MAHATLLQYRSYLARRSILALYDLLSICLIAALLTGAFVRPAYAYVDPSVMTYTIQALAGVAVALSAVAGVALRRTRKAIFSLLKIDENANKIKDPEIVRLEPDDEASFEAARAEARRIAEESIHGKPAPVLTWKQRLLRALAVSFFACFTLLFVGPYELVVGNANDLIFGIDTVFPVLVVMTLAASILMAFAMSVVRGRAFDYVLCFFTAVGACFWMQALFLNSALPSADGMEVRWEDYDFVNAQSCLSWFVVCLAFLILCIKSSLGARLACLFVPFALILVQTVGVVSLAVNPPESTSDSSSYFMSQEGLFEVSPTNNVIVFVLDTVDSVVVEEIRNEFPDLFGEYTGFTYFPNALSAFIPTRYGVPYMLTGSMPSHDETWFDYVLHRYDRSTFMQEIHEADYSMGIYTDTIKNGAEQLKQYAFNVSDSSNASMLADESFSPVSAACILAKTAAYRSFIWPFKPFFHYYTGDINNAFAGVGESNDGSRASVESKAFSMMDPQFYKNLTSVTLEASDTRAGGAFRFIHLNGAHTPYTMDENAQDQSRSLPVDTTTVEQQTRGTIMVVGEYLRQLKELGVYDQATIVVTSDHGTFFTQIEPLESPDCGFMVVKPGNQSAQEAAAPCRVSQAPTGQMDFCATVMNAVGGDYTKYGRTVFEIGENEERTRLYNALVADSNSDWGIREYAVTGNALDFNNWSLTGYYWDCGNTHKTPSALGQTLADINFTMPGVEHPILCGGNY